MKQLVAFDGVVGLVNPHLIGNVWRSRFAFDKSFRVVAISVVEYVLSVGLDLLCAPVMHGIGCEQPQAAVPVLGVVPGEEALEVGTRFQRTGEAPGV